MIEIILLVFGVGIIIILVLVSTPKVKHHYGKVRADFEKLDEKDKSLRKKNLHDSLNSAVKHYTVLGQGIISSITDLDDPYVDSSAFLTNLKTLDEAVDEVIHYRQLLLDIGERVDLDSYHILRVQIRTGLKKLLQKRNDVDAIKQSTSYVVL